jgi:hypothetical protein
MRHPWLPNELAPSAETGNLLGHEQVNHTGEASSPLRYGMACPNASSVIALASDYSDFSIFFPDVLH